MIDTVFGIKVKNQVYVLIGNRPIIGRLLHADYRPLPYRCTSNQVYIEWMCSEENVNVSLYTTF